jgi:dTDP-4-amino-4,6-dideoxygalactose transaminase
MIPFSSPKLSYLAHHEEITLAIERVLQSGYYINGPEVSRFESAFAAYIGAEQGVGVASGTDALHLVLRAAGIGVGDEVITVSHTAVATVAAIEMTGATPVLVDIEPLYFTMDPQQVQLAITAKTKAVIAVHLYGQAADLDSLSQICRSQDILLIEDCAQAHGATYGGRKVGTFGDAACFSFYPTKNLGAIGDGGMVVTSHQDLAQKCRSIREYGWKHRYTSEVAGINSRLDEIQAAILNVKLEYLDRDNRARQMLADRYFTALKNLPITLPQQRQGCSHVFHLFVIQAPHRDALQNHLEKHEILTGIHYPVPIHLQPAYRGRIKSLPMPHTERVSGEILSLPMYPQLGSDSLDDVTATITQRLAPIR